MIVWANAFGRTMCAWFLAGTAVEALNMLMRTWSAVRMDPQRPASAIAWTALGFLFRLGCTMLVLGLALSQSLPYGLAAFAGCWLCRLAMIQWMSRRMADRYAYRKGPRLGG